MMKRISKIIAVILCCVAVILSSAVFVHAEGGVAQAAVSVSSSSVKVGAEFTVTVKFTSSVGMGSVDSILKYNSDTVTFISGAGANGAAGSVNLSAYSLDSNGDKTFTFSLKFKAKAAGSSNFSLSGTEISDFDFGKMTVNDASKSIQVVKDVPLSNNNYLSGIKLSTGTLSPKFAKKTLNYTVNVPNETTTIRVTATCEDSKAKCTVTGSGSLKVGSNEIKITVTAENGSKKTYKVTVKRAAAAGESQPPVSSETPSVPPVESEDTPTDITILFDGSEYTVVEDYSFVAIPDGFSQTVCTVNGTQVMAVTNVTKSVTMVYLADSEQNGSFYIYDTAEITYTPYRTIVVGKNVYVPLSKPRGLVIPSGFSTAELKIGEQSFAAWISDDNSDFYMIYLCHIDSKPALYMYDATEGTVMRYLNMENSHINPVNKPSNEANAPAPSESRLWVYINSAIAATLILFVICTVVLLILLAKSKNSVSQKAAPSKDEFEFSDEDFEAIEVTEAAEVKAAPVMPEPIADEAEVPPEAAVPEAENGNEAAFGDDFVIR